MTIRQSMDNTTTIGVVCAWFRHALKVGLVLLCMVLTGAIQLASAHGVSTSVIEAFLRGHHIVEPDDTLPEPAYVLAGEQQRLLSGAGDTLYVRGHVPADGRLGIYRPGALYRDEQGRLLGHELLNIGEARWLNDDGDIARLEVLTAQQEVRVDDLVLPLDHATTREALTPHHPGIHIAGRILGVPGGQRFIGRMQMITLNVGMQDGLQPGHMLQVNQAGALIDDPRTGAPTQLPDTPAGQALVIKPYQRVSYALVTQASRVLEVGDHVIAPTHQHNVHADRR